MFRNTVELCLATLLVFITTRVFANEMCDTLGDTAQGIALNKRDAGVSEQALLDQVKERKPGGLTEENRALMISMVKMVYARRDLSPAQLSVLASASCEGVSAR